MYYQLLGFLVFLLVGIVFVVATVALVGRLARPRVSSPAEPGKEETYECGEPPAGSSWVRFDIRFYTLALIFLIFDVEVALLYPWAIVFKPLREGGAGGFILVEVLLFLVILMVGFAYCWCRGDLDWIKSVPGRRPLATAGTAGDRADSAVTAAPGGSESR